MGSHLRDRIGRAVLLAVATATCALAIPASASAASCASGTTNWTNAAGGNFGDAANWDNGSPASNCDAVINLDGTYTVTLDGTANVKSLTMGTTTTTGTQTLIDTSTSSAGNIIASSGITNGARGAITLDCPMGGCASGGTGPGIDVQAAMLTNSGAVTVTAAASAAGVEPAIKGDVTNATGGVLQFNGNTLLTHSTVDGLLVNHGTINLANGVTVTSEGDSCGAPNISVTNGTGGQINATGTGTLEPAHYFQGAGTTSGTAPVTMICGALTYNGTGSSTILDAGSIFVSGDIAAGQTLNVTAHLSPTAAFTNAGTINFDSSVPGGTIDLGDATLTNTGTITAFGDPGSTIHARTLVNSGSLLVNSNLTVEASGNHSCNQPCLSNQGDIEIGTSSTLLVFEGFDQTAGTTELNGATAKLQTVGAPVAIHGGALGGTGIVQGSLTNGGTVSPGSASTPGTLQVAGNYTEEAGGRLDARVTSSANDRLSVGGSATLAGTLAIATTGFSPTLGTSFTVVSDGSQAGQFDTVTGASSGPYDVVYDPTDVKLVTKMGGPPPAGPTASVDSPSVRNPGPGGDGTLTFTVTLSAAPGGTGATIDYATANGTARAPADYAATSGTLTFGPAETTKTVTVTVHGTGAGPDRTLFLNLSNPTGATLSQNRGTGTIQNDRVTLGSVTPPKGGTCGTVTVNLHGAGFTGTPAVHLTRSGQPDIVATDIAAGRSGQDLTATFDLTGAAPGARDVVVSLPSFGASATLPAAFEVQPVIPPILTATLSGAASASPMYPWTGLLFVANSGNVDATDVTVRVDGFHAGAAIQVVGSGVTSVTEAAGGSTTGVVISIKRVHAGANVGMLVRFVPKGAAHTIYHLRPVVTGHGGECGGASGSLTTPPPPDPPGPGRVDPPGTTHVEIVTPGDPNDKTGAGFGPGHFVLPSAPLPYHVMFENMPTASAPAHDIKVTDQLDPQKVDLSTLALGPVYFGDTVVSPPPGAQSWDTTVDLRPAKNLVVEVTADLDRRTGLLSWRLAGRDPGTGDLATEPDRGFLPPDTAPPVGRGGATFTVMPKAGLATGAQIANSASIVFDQNAPIATPTFTNTIDASTPSSHVASAKPLRACKRLKLSWSGKDTGAGVTSFDVIAARGKGRFRRWKSATTKRSGVYPTGRAGSYAFYTAATDGVGHVEGSHKTADLRAKIGCVRKGCAATTTTAAWDALVRSTAQHGRTVTVVLNKRAAASLHVTALRVTVNGRTKATAHGSRLPARITLAGVPTGHYVLTLRASTAQGTLRGIRTAAIC
jgi:hypothetical protein